MPPHRAHFHIARLCPGEMAAPSQQFKRTQSRCWSCQTEEMNFGDLPKGGFVVSTFSLMASTLCCAMPLPGEHIYRSDRRRDNFESIIEIITTKQEGHKRDVVLVGTVLLLQLYNLMFAQSCNKIIVTDPSRSTDQQAGMSG